MKQSFKIQAVTWHEVSDMIDVDPIHEALNTYLDLSKYGKGIKQISFVYVAVKPDNTIHTNEAEYIKEDNILELQLRLSYRHVLNASPSKILEMMAALFLVSIDLYEEFNIPDFDIATFKRDTLHLFDTKGWLKQVANR